MSVTDTAIKPCEVCDETGELLQGFTVIRCRDCSGRGYLPVDCLLCRDTMLLGNLPCECAVTS